MIPRDAKAVVVVGAAQTRYERRPGDDVTTAGVLAAAVNEAIADSGIPRHEIDGLGVASFTLAPDRVIDLAWKLGLSLRWMMEEPLALTMMQHARRAIENGDARNIVIVGGDRMDASRFRDMTSQYNAVTAELLVPIGAVGPNAQFSLVTAAHRERHGVGIEPYGQIVMHQRRRASLNRNGLFTEPLDMQGYRAAPRVTSELGLFDCVPLVTGASAVVLSDANGGRDPAITILGYQSRFNIDHQEGSGLRLGLRELTSELWRESGVGPDDVDIANLYDDYPVIVLQQLEELGYLQPADLNAFGADGFGEGRPVVNASGGLLCCGQAGAGGTLHGVVDAVEQLRGRGGAGQVTDARTALVTNYGMVLYRYGACMAVMLLGVR